MADLARKALIQGALRKLFCDEEQSFQEFLANHSGKADPYEDCSDNFCRHARMQADDVLSVLSAAGFTVTPVRRA